MLTQCPSCQTIFRVTGTILRAAHGQVRCGRCNTQFDSIDHLLDDDEQDSSATQTSLKSLDFPLEQSNDASHPGVTTHESVEHEDIVMEGHRIEISGIYPRPSTIPDTEELTSTHTTIDEFNLDNDARDDAISSLSEDQADRREADPDAALDDIEAAMNETSLLGALASLDEDNKTDEPVATDHQTSDEHSTSDPHTSESTRTLTDINPWLSTRPAEVDSTPFERHSESRRWPWVIASFMLMLVLAGQLIHHYRQDLARHPGFGPQLTGIYATLGQPLSPPWDLHFYNSKLWGIVSDPQSVSTLRVRASVTNSATFAQPYPWVQLSLEDRFGVRVGSRAFKPDEYLGNNAQATRLLAAGESANIDLAIVDPGQDAVGWHFDTCLPLTTGLHCTHDSGG